MPQLLWTLATNTMYVHAIDVEITNLVSGDLCEILTDLNQVAWWYALYFESQDFCHTTTS